MKKYKLNAAADVVVAIAAAAAVGSHLDHRDVNSSRKLGHVRGLQRDKIKRSSIIQQAINLPVSGRQRKDIVAITERKKMAAREAKICQKEKRIFKN